MSRATWLSYPIGFIFTTLFENKSSGAYTGGETPDPIPNSEVKPSRADDTAGETRWESRSAPGDLYIFISLKFLTSFLPY